MSRTEDERTPKPSTVRSGWVKGHPFPLTTEPEEREAEFDRMIAAVEAAVRADQIERDAGIAERECAQVKYLYGTEPTDHDLGFCQAAQEIKEAITQQNQETK